MVSQDQSFESMLTEVVFGPEELVRPCGRIAQEKQKQRWQWRCCSPRPEYIVGSSMICYPADRNIRIPSTKLCLLRALRRGHHQPAARSVRYLVAPGICYRPTNNKFNCKISRFSRKNTVGT